MNAIPKDVDDVSHLAYPRQDRLVDIKKKSQKNAALSIAKTHGKWPVKTPVPKGSNHQTRIQSINNNRPQAGLRVPLEQRPATIKQCLKDSRTGFSCLHVGSLDKARAVPGAWKTILVGESRPAQDGVSDVCSFPAKGLGNSFQESKQPRRRGPQPSHGDFRGYLYEATMNSILKNTCRPDKAQK